MTAGFARPTSVVYVITALGVGGANLQVLALSRAFKARGWDVGIISMMPPKIDLSGVIAEGIRVAHLGMRRGVGDPRAALRLRRQLRAWAPSVVHSHMVHANLLTRVTRLIAPVPVLISTAHNFNEGSAWRYLAYRVTDRLTDLTTNVSAAATAEAIRRGAVAADRVRMIPNGVDLARYEAASTARADKRRELGLADDFLWLAAGRFVPAKDYGNMLRAFAQSRADAARPTLAIAGIGPEQAAMRELADALGIGSDVRFLGLRADLPELMAAADGFVLSSAWEGLPLVLLEAAASALPIVATDVGGNREIVRHGTSGWLVAPHDSAALAGRMAELMNLVPAERAALGTEGRRHVTEHYALERVVDTWESVYLDALRRAGVRLLARDT
jgi:glycosyltransferase involved in cell wall biosynthesis